VWKAWRELGELNASTTFMSRQVGRLRWDITVDGEPLDPDTADELIAAVTGPDGPAAVTSRMALHVLVAGHFRYVQDTGGTWRVVVPGKRPPAHRHSQPCRRRVDGPAAAARP
jgi:hypothetical protein